MPNFFERLLSKLGFARASGEAATGGVTPQAGPQPLDPDKLFPLVVPTGYLSADSGSALVDVVDGLQVALVIDHSDTRRARRDSHAGVIQYVRSVDLAAKGLDARAALPIAYKNLLTAASNGVIQPMGTAGPDGVTPMVIWSDHWLAATCILLPGLHAMAETTLGTDQIVAAIPHRDALILFGAGTPESRRAMVELIRREEGPHNRKPITERLFLLRPEITAFYERAPFDPME